MIPGIFLFYNERDVLTKCKFRFDVFNLRLGSTTFSVNRRKKITQFNFCDYWREKAMFGGCLTLLDGEESK